MSAGLHGPKPECDDDALSLFGFEDEGWVGLMRDAARPEELGRVAGYQVLEEVGRGGQGVVFRARRESGGRVVALKRLAAGSLAGSEARARFQREIEAEAVLRHPNIVGFQGVEVVEGQPLLVMEWIDGRPADQWARETGEGAARPLREVLGAFARACDAVSYAHQRGVIHRDLKPSNILIDAAGEPHVLDFGLARWRSDVERRGAGPEISRLTRTEGFLGTPAYAAPEQLTPGSGHRGAPGGAESGAAGDTAGGADVRADVYALGVVLYAMLTGRRPFQEREGDWEGLLRAIREEAAAPPSRHDRRVGGEVDAIVLRAMAKDPERRYQSAHELCVDVRRYLAGEPVAARRDSAWYVARKFVGRHRVAVGAAALVVLSLAAGMAGTTLALTRAEQRRVEAETAREQTQRISDFQAEMLSGIDAEAMGRAIKDRFREQVRASLERQYTQEGALRRPRTPEEVEAELAAFDLRADAAQTVDVARRVMDEVVLARAADAVETRFADQPAVRADLHFALGRTYSNLGLYAAAEPRLRLALEIRRGHFGPDASPEVAASLYNLAGLMHDRGRVVEAEALYRESLAMWRHLSDEELVPRTLAALGGMLISQRRIPEAEPMLEEALLLQREVYGEQHEEVFHTLSALAGVRFRQGRLDEAEAMERQILAWRRGHYGDRHATVAATLSNLSQTLAAQRRHAEAEQLLREALGILIGVHGDEHPDVAKRRFQLGREVIRQGRRREGEDLYRQALAQQRALLGDEHAEVRVTLRDLAESRWQDGDPDEAAALMREALAIAKRVYPDGHPEAFRRYSTMNMLGAVLASQARAMLDTDRARALALVDEAERLTWGGVVGMTGMPLEDLEGKRRTAESMIAALARWHEIDPGGGWEERAAKWKAELERIPRP